MSIPSRVAVLNADGTTDTSFDPGLGLDAVGYTVNALASGKFAVGGDFTQVDFNTRPKLAVLEADGTVDPLFDVTPNGAVRSLIAQTDGKVLFGGNFTSPTNRLARLEADFTVETAYNPNVDGPVYALANQEDGKTLAGGDFGTVGGTTRNNLARLYNNEAPTALTIESVSLVQWLRGGASQEVERVSFEEPAGTAIAGDTTRVSGGWQFVPTTPLSGTGTVTVRAYPTDSHSEGVIQDSVSYNVDPEIQVEEGGTILVDAVSTVAYGSLQVGLTLAKVFTIRNIGLDVLTLNATPAALSGANADQWAIVAQPSSPVDPGDSVTFTLNFIPTATGAKVAVLTITSDDADEGTFTINLTGTATPGPGGEDATWQPVLNGIVYGSALDRTNLIWLAGSFTTINGLNRGRYARLNLTGSVQTQTGVGATPDTILAVCQLPDGKCYIGGTFTTVNGVARTRLARLNADGSLDTTFNIAVNGDVAGFAYQPDGAVLLCGSFSTVGGVARSGVARLTSTGALDVAFNPSIGSFSRGVTLQSDGKIILYGQISYSIPTSTTLRRGIVRLEADGSRDTTFDAQLNGSVFSAVIDADGKIIISGSYTTIAGVSRTGVNRLSALGVHDTTFAENQTLGTSLALQCDGKTVIGAYTAGSLAATERLTRVSTTGVNDATFVATARNNVTGVLIQEDGNIVVTGQFTLAGGSTKFASRVINDTSGASSVLSVVSQTQVQWLRSGTMPDTQVVVFDYSQDGGSTWTRLGQGTRVGGGWDLSSISLPISGTLRAQAFVPCGYANGSLSVLEDQVAFSNLAVGDLNIEYPVGTTLADNATLNFAGTLPGQFLEYTLTLRNTGNAAITSILATANGDWSITSSPASTLAVNQTTTLVLRFSPSAVGQRGTMALVITSSVPGAENPYTVYLTGNGVAVPVATTGTSTSPGVGQRTLNGTFKANHDTATAYFQYKIASATTWIDSLTSTIGGFSNTAVQKTVSGLLGGQTYQFRAIIYNAVNAGQPPASPFVGAIGTFTT